MAPGPVSQQPARSGGHQVKRGSRGRINRGRPRGTSQGNKNTATQELGPTIPESAKDHPEETNKSSDASTEVAQADDDVAICWICAEPVKYYSVSTCNHRTCHVCALRLRALYKKLDCTFCKEPQHTVIFTISPDASFSSFTPESIPHKDSKLSIYFETLDMMEDTLILLRFNCPDLQCDYTAAGWGDLKMHVRASHGKLICDLCLRSKKVFAHEHALYPPNILPLHLPSMSHRSNKQPSMEQIEGGVHPMCDFCRECFFSGDELYSHMRERHEECFVCKRNEARDKYFQNYESLERHFTNAHFPCNQAQCLAQKFVVFGSALDLKGHMVEVHGSDMSARDKKDARRIQAEFEFEDSGAGASGRHGRRDREREPPPQNSSVPTVQSRPSGRRREGFGAHLTVEGNESGTPNISTAPSRPASPSPPRDNVDPIVAQRHAVFIARLQAIAPNPTNATSAVKAAVRGYRAAESSARDLISTIWNVLDNNLDDTATIVNGVVDLLDEEEKKTALLSSWNGFKIEQRRQFPDLTPTSVGSGYAGITSGRVLNAKHATTSRSSHQSFMQVWDRVAQVAGSSSSPSHSPAPSRSPAPRPPDIFPALPANSSGVPAFRQGQRNTPWASSSAAGVRPPSSVPAPAIAARKVATTTHPPPALSSSAFPQLPTATSTRSKPVIGGNQSLKYIVGETTPATPAWKAGSGNTPPAQGEPTGTGEGVASEGTSGKGKKGKGKQKQMLFTLGSFPT